MFLTDSENDCMTVPAPSTRVDLVARRPKAREEGADTVMQSFGLDGKQASGDPVYQEFGNCPGSVVVSLCVDVAKVRRRTGG